MEYLNEILHLLISFVTNINDTYEYGMEISVILPETYFMTESNEKSLKYDSLLWILFVFHKFRNIKTNRKAIKELLLKWVIGFLEYSKIFFE